MLTTRLVDIDIYIIQVFIICGFINIGKMFVFIKFFILANGWRHIWFLKNKYILSICPNCFKIQGTDSPTLSCFWGESEGIWT